MHTSKATQPNPIRLTFDRANLFLISLTVDLFDVLLSTDQRKQSSIKTNCEYRCNLSDFHGGFLYHRGLMIAFFPTPPPPRWSNAILIDSGFSEEFPFRLHDTNCFFQIDIHTLR